MTKPTAPIELSEPKSRWTWIDWTIFFIAIAFIAALAVYGEMI